MTLQKYNATRAEIMWQFDLSNEFITDWTSKAADSHKSGKSSIPQMPHFHIGKQQTFPIAKAKGVQQ